MGFKFHIFIFLCFFICVGECQQQPCEKLINIFADVSNTLSLIEFTIQQTFISSIISNTTNLKKIKYGKYAESESSIIVPWNSSISKTDYINTVTHTKQWNKPASIYRAFQELSLAVLSDHTLHFSTIIFITDTSNDDEINGAVEMYEKYLKPKIFLTLIATGDKAYVSKLAAFEAQVFDWRDLTKPYPNGWDLNVAEGCIEATTAPTSTLAPSTTTTPLESYIPCPGLITVLTDISNVLSADHFLKQINFASSFLSQVSHPERIQYGSFCSLNASITYSWNPQNSEFQLQKAIKNTYQIQNAIERLGYAMQLLLENNTKNKTAIIFVADTSSTFDIQKALSFYKSLKKSTKLTFILVGEKANAESLVEFNATIFDWKNMDLEKPKEWDVAKAFGC